MDNSSYMPSTSNSSSSSSTSSTSSSTSSSLTNSYLLNSSNSLSSNLSNSNSSTYSLNQNQNNLSSTNQYTNNYTTNQQQQQSFGLNSNSTTIPSTTATTNSFNNNNNYYNQQNYLPINSYNSYDTIKPINSNLSSSANSSSSSSPSSSQSPLTSSNSTSHLINNQIDYYQNGSSMIPQNQVNLKSQFYNQPSSSSTSTDQSNSYNYNSNYQSANYWPTSSSSSTTYNTYDQNNYPIYNEFDTQYNYYYPTNTTTNNNGSTNSSQYNSTTSWQQTQPYQTESSNYPTNYETTKVKTEIPNGTNDLNYSTNQATDVSSLTINTNPQTANYDTSYLATNPKVYSKLKKNSSCKLKGAITKRKIKEEPKLKNKLNDEVKNEEFLLDDDLEIRNLSIETNISNSSNSSSDQTFFNSKHLISIILKEIEIKKVLIRTAQNEFKIKEYLTDLTRNLLNHFQTVTNLNQTNNNKMINQTIDSNIMQNKMKRPLLIAYSYLIDDNNNNNNFTINNNKSSVLLFLTCDLSPYEINLLNQLHKIYSTNNSNNKKLDPITNNDTLNNSTYFYPQYSYQDQSSYYNQQQSNYNYQQYSSNQINFNTESTKTEHNELKILHFLLILFSSFLSIDKFIQTNNESTTNDCDLDASQYQKLILQLIDNVCKDKLIKTKILLSVSDLDLI